MAEGNIIFRLQASVIMGLDGPGSQIRCVGDTVATIIIVCVI